MNIQAQKIELIQMLLSTKKPNVIKKIKAVFEEAEIYPYTLDDSKVSIELLKKEILDAEADIKAGRTYSASQIKAHFKK